MLEKLGNVDVRKYFGNLITWWKNAGERPRRVVFAAVIIAVIFVLLAVTVVVIWWPSSDVSAAKDNPAPGAPAKNATQEIVSTMVSDLPARNQQEVTVLPCPGGIYYGGAFDLVFTTVGNNDACEVFMDDSRFTMPAEFAQSLLNGDAELTILVGDQVWIGE